MDYQAFFRQITNNNPYPYQAALARDGLPDVLNVPTGCGKTAAAVLAWMFRRRHHPSAEVRRSTPRWLTLALPLRTLVEQQWASAKEWVDAESEISSGHPPIQVHLLRGGEDRASMRAWMDHPEGDAIFVSTMDMALSRALNRGYGVPRFVQPIEFGFFNNDVQWVFDETQLMGVGFPTSVRLQGLRESVQTFGPTHTLWMSATVSQQLLDSAWLNPDRALSSRQLTEDDRSGGLSVRLGAERTFAQVEVPSKGFEKPLAERVLAEHMPGTNTIAVCNRVKDAQALYSEVVKLIGGDEAPDVLLIHSRFRGADRDALTKRLTATPGPTGRIIISTQVIEAGIDISCRTMFTQLAPWSSLVQRAGRCNRDGLSEGAQFLWFEPSNALPYTAEECAASADLLRSIEGTTLTNDQLSTLGEVEAAGPFPALRRSDLYDLFDTTPDLTGNVIDVSVFIRDVESLDVQVAWMDLPDSGDPPPVRYLPTEQVCGVPIGQFRQFLDAVSRKTKAAPEAWRFDASSGSRAGGWQRIVRDRVWQVVPGDLCILSSSVGGLDDKLGWTGIPGKRVSPLVTGQPEMLVGDDSGLETLEEVGDDTLSVKRDGWVTLDDHLHDVQVAASQLTAALLAGDVVGFTEQMAAAVSSAAIWHDVGKAHPVFQQTLRNGSFDPPTDGLWAKSVNLGRHTRPFFRHELVSLLMLLDDDHPAFTDIDDRDLVRYLVASHHGRIRVGVQSHPHEKPIGDEQPILGVLPSDVVGPISVLGHELPETKCSLEIAEFGGAGRSRSWTDRALELRDRLDLGPFKLAYLEGVVRLADWHASAAPSTVHQGLRKPDTHADPTGPRGNAGTANPNAVLDDVSNDNEGVLA